MGCGRARALLALQGAAPDRLLGGEGLDAAAAGASPPIFGDGQGIPSQGRGAPPILLRNVPAEGNADPEVSSEVMSSNSFACSVNIVWVAGRGMSGWLPDAPHS